jgi:hypothetical protein
MLPATPHNRGLSVPCAAWTTACGGRSAVGATAEYTEHLISLGQAAKVPAHGAVRTLRRGGRRGSRCCVVVLVVRARSVRQLRRVRHRYVWRGAEDLRPEEPASPQYRRAATDNGGMVERALVVLAHARTDDLPDVITILCRMASWSAAAGRQQDQDAAVAVAGNLMEERAQLQRLGVREGLV